MPALDHFVFGTAELAKGRAWMEDALGLPPVGAGAHAAMGTHNALWRVGNAYLEVIAIDPEAPAPGRPLWYGLSDPATQTRIAKTPQLLTWVVTSEDPEATRAVSPIDPGPPMEFTRDDLHWQLTVPPDGLPPENGAFPAVIHWPEGITSPATALPDQGLSIGEFVVSGSSALQSALASIGADTIPDRLQDAPQGSLSLTLESPNTGSVHLA